MQSAEGNEKGNLTLTVEGGGGKARLVVFPIGEDGAYQPLLQGETVTVPRWETTKGAVVWVMDLSDDGQLKLRVTADFSAAEGLQFALQTSESTHPETENRVVVNYALRVLPPDGLDVKTPEGKKKFEEMTDKWFRERGDDWVAHRLWLHVVATVAGRTHHFYGHAGGTSWSAVALMSGKILLPRKVGTYKVDASVKFMGQTYTCSHSLKLQLPDGREVYGRDAIMLALKDIEKLKAENADPDRLAYAYSGLGSLYASIWNDEAAREAWTTGLSYAKDEGRKNGFLERFANNAWERGEFDEAAAGLEKLGQMIRYEEHAQWTLWLKNDWNKARVIFHKLPGLKPEDEDRWQYAPHDGERIAE